MWICLIMTGVTISVRLRHRLNFLEDVVYMFVVFKSNISYFHQPLSEIISTFNKNEKQIDFIRFCTYKLNSGIDFPDAWEDSVKNYCPLLKEEEKVKLIEYGKSIGKTDTENQTVILDTYYRSFECFNNKAKEDFNKYNRTVIAAFFFLGCGLFILLI